MTPQNHTFNSTFAIKWTHRLRSTTNAFENNSVLTEIMDELDPVRILVVIDSGVVDKNPTIIQKIESWYVGYKQEYTPPLIVQGGEDAKNNNDVVDSVLHAINEQKICRASCVLVIGGGAVLDAVGYATSIAHRGIHLVRMPTTTLSACDSGVGVKNGINYFGKKNFIGVFSPPFAVINDLSLLSSLSDRHWRSGLSEAIKVALVKDAPFYHRIHELVLPLNNRNNDAITEVIEQSAMLHFRHITEGGDPFERLDARPLDFGHWAGHKLEQLSQFEVTHGEAVSIGLCIDLQCSVILGYLNEELANQVISLLGSLGLPTKHALLSDLALLDGIEEFREHLGGKLTLLMIEEIGKPVEVHQLENSVVQQAIRNLM